MKRFSVRVRRRAWLVKGPENRRFCGCRVAGAGERVGSSPAESGLASGARAATSTRRWHRARVVILLPGRGHMAGRVRGRAAGSTSKALVSRFRSERRCEITAAGVQQGGVDQLAASRFSGADLLGAYGGVRCLREGVARRPWMAGGTGTDVRAAGAREDCRSPASRVRPCHRQRFSSSRCDPSRECARHDREYSASRARWSSRRRWIAPTGAIWLRGTPRPLDGECSRGEPGAGSLVGPAARTRGCRVKVGRPGSLI
jgi:hypothetical protein